LQLELRALELVLGLFHRRIVFGQRDAFLGLFLRYLPDQVFVRALFIQIVFRLCLRIEFNEDVALVYVRPGGGQLGNDHRTDLRAFQPGGQDYEGTRSLGAPIQPQRCREVFSFHSDDGFLDTGSRPAGAEMCEKEGAHNEEEHNGCTQDEFPGPSAGFSCLDHRLDYPGNFRRTRPATGHLEFKSRKMVASFQSRQSHILAVPEFISELAKENARMGCAHLYQRVPFGRRWRIPSNLNTAKNHAHWTPFACFGYTECLNSSGKTR